MNQCKLESGMKFISKLEDKVVLFNDFDGGRFEIWTPSKLTNPLAHLVTIEGKKYNFLCADLTLDLALEKLKERQHVEKDSRWVIFGVVLASCATVFIIIEAFFK